MAYDNFKDLVFDAFLAFQKKTRRASLTAFADYLSENNAFKTRISPSLLSGWMNGDFTPGDKFAIVLADVLPKLIDIKSEEIFDLLGTQFTLDKDFTTLAALWPHLSEEARHTLREQGEKYVTENEKSTVRSGPLEKAT